jgi:chromosome segregation ATPase
MDDAFARLGRIMEAGFNTLADLQRETNARLDQTNARLDQTNARLDQTNVRLDQHEKVLVRLAEEVHSLNARFDNFLTGAHREEHDALRTRVERIEEHLGIAKRH